MNTNKVIQELVTEIKEAPPSFFVQTIQSLTILRFQLEEALKVGFQLKSKIPDIIELWLTPVGPLQPSTPILKVITVTETEAVLQRPNGSTVVAHNLEDLQVEVIKILQEPVNVRLLQVFYQAYNGVPGSKQLQSDS
jgi:hypothetical protein